jgi:hypothetical protein
MASFTLVNNLESLVVDNPLTATATTLNLYPGDGVNFPSTFPYLLTIWNDVTYPDPSDDPNYEIVRVINKSVDALSITREQEGTTGVIHAASSRVAMLITAGMFNDAVYGITTKLDTIEPNADVTVNNPPQAHAVSHTDGTDDVQDATPTQKGLATSAQITKLDSIEPGAESNNISDTDATDLTDGGETVLHSHAGGGGAVDSVFGRTGVVVATAGDYDHSQLDTIGANDHHNETHTIVSHDTDATGVELNSLTDGSNADSLHSHSGSGAGDMTMAVYDVNGNGIVDNSEALQDGVGTKTYSDISTEIDSDISTHAADSDAHHAEIHTLVSHDTAVTGAQLDTDHTKLSGIATGADVTADNPPQSHAISHVNGIDEIQSATNVQKGVATAAHIIAVEANTVKATNATHSGDATGSSALTLENVAISNKTLVTAVGADHVLIGDASDSNNLKKALISDFASAGGDMSASVYDPNTIADDAFDMTNMVESASRKILSSTERLKLTSIAPNADVTGNNPPQAHDLSGSLHNNTLLAALNAKITDATLIDTGDSRLSDNRNPTVHAVSHTDGTDDIQSATNAVKGLATSAHISAIEANTAKITNTTHTGDVTGDGALTISTSAVDILMLSATGTPGSTTYLRGDNTWSTPLGGGGGDMLKSVYDTGNTGIVDLTLEQARSQGNILTGPIVFNPTSDMTIIDISGNNNDLTWMLGHTDDRHGFYWKYHGTGLGDANYLTINSENSTSLDFWHMRFHQLTHVVDVESSLNMGAGYTVDGRDVSTDGTKLDTIETNAEVNNISDVNAASLTDGSEITLHSHAGGGGAVDSVFGRTGVVVAATNDYAHNQLSGVGVNDHHNETHDLNSHGSCTLAELSTDISDATLASIAGTETFTHKIIELDDALGTNQTYEGTIVNDAVGEAVVFGNLLYMNSDGRWWKSSSAVANGTEFPVTAMALETSGANTIAKLLLNGTVRNDAWNFTTIGKVFCGVDVPTHTQPSTPGHTMQIIGRSYNAGRMYFNPDNIYLELS